MTGELPWTVPDPYAAPVRTVDPEAYALGRVYGALMGVAASTSPRSLQNEIGSSELGHTCERRLAYRLTGAPTVNTRDPLATLIGTGWHGAAADLFRRLSVLMGGRFLVEQPITYRGVPGTCDLYDKETKTVVDWKTSTLDKISHLKSQGPSSNYVVQTQTYAAGLAAMGYGVRHVALAFVPRDGTELNQMWVWRAPFNPSIADAAIDRLEALRGKAPADVKASPDRLCAWCSHFLPGSTDLSIGCPADAAKEG